MAGIDNLDLLQPQKSTHADTHTHQPIGEATHVQADVYVSNGGKCEHRHQILLDDEAESILVKLKPAYGSFNAVIRAALKTLYINR